MSFTHIFSLSLAIKFIQDNPLETKQENFSKHWSLSVPFSFETSHFLYCSCYFQHQENYPVYYYCFLFSCFSPVHKFYHQSTPWYFFSLFYNQIQIITKDYKMYQTPNLQWRQSWYRALWKPNKNSQSTGRSVLPERPCSTQPDKSSDADETSVCRVESITQEPAFQPLTRYYSRRLKLLELIRRAPKFFWLICRCFNDLCRGSSAHRKQSPSTLTGCTAYQQQFLWWRPAKDFKASVRMAGKHPKVWYPKTLRTMSWNFAGLPSLAFQWWALLWISIILSRRHYDANATAWRLTEQELASRETFNQECNWEREVKMYDEDYM